MPQHFSNVHGLKNEAKRKRRSSLCVAAKITDKLVLHRDGGADRRDQCTPGLSGEFRLE